MLIKGTPCPKCDGFYFLVPWCEKCGWKDEEWFKEQLRRDDELMKLFLETFEITRGSIAKARNDESN